jgi:importin subunit alpha-6/7
MTDGLALLGEHIRSNVLDLQLDAVIKIRKLTDGSQVEHVLALNVMDRFVDFLASESVQLQFETAWVLTNIACGSSAETRAVVDAGAVPRLVALMRSPHKNVREQAIWALGNIAGDCLTLRDYVLTHDAMPLLLDCFSDMSQVSLVRVATQSLSNFCRGKPQPSSDVVQPALGVLCSLIRGDDAEVLSDACCALSHLLDGPACYFQALDAGVLPRLVQLLEHETPNVVTSALRCVGNITAVNSRQAQQVLDLNVLALLKKLLDSPNQRIREVTCWMISTITAGSVWQIKMVVDSGVVSTLVSMLGSAPLGVKEAICWVLKNAVTGGSMTLVKKAVQSNVLRALADVQDEMGADALASGVANMAHAVHDAILRRLDDLLIYEGNIGIETAAYISERCASGDVRFVLESPLLAKLASLPHADLTREAKQSIARTAFICYNGATSAQLDDLADTGIFSQLYVIRDRAATICIAMQELALPALLTLELLDAAFPNDIPMHKKWQLVTAVKHFK